MAAQSALIRVLVVDDSSSARAVLRSMMEEDSCLHVVGEAGNGEDAIALADLLKPNLITMDMNMPGMGGIKAIAQIMSSKAIPILVVSGQCDAQLSYEAIACGALDVMAKPDLTEGPALIAKIKLLAGVPVITRRNRPPKSSPAQVKPRQPVDEHHLSIFAIASSTGGPQALGAILGALPDDFPCPVLVAQHISEGFATGFAQWLDLNCHLTVRLAQEGDVLMPGVVYISPSESNLVVTKWGTLSLAVREQKQIYHPSCDLLLSSVAEVYGKRAIGIILTGMGRDGAVGMGRIAEAGGYTLAQDEASSIVYGMNKEAIQSGCIHKVISLSNLASVMCEMVISTSRFVA